MSSPDHRPNGRLPPTLALFGALLLAVAALGFAAGTIERPVKAINGTAVHRGMDALPLYLGAHALANHQDPNDPLVLRRHFEFLALQVSVGGFLNYYPRTAPVLWLPVRTVPYASLVPPLRVVLLIAIAGAAMFGVLAGAVGGTPDGRPAAPPPSRLARATRSMLLLAAVAAMVGWAWSLCFTAPILETAQPGPLVALLSAVGLWAMARRHDYSAGVSIALGAALKFASGLLLVPALLAGRGRTVGAAVVVLGVLLGISFVLYPGLGSANGAVLGFLAPNHLPVAVDSELLLEVWQRRSWVLPPTVIGLGWAAARGVPVVTSGAFALAAGGVIIAGIPHPHESIQTLPVFAFIVGRALRPGASLVTRALPFVLLLVSYEVGAFVEVDPKLGIRFLPVALVAWSALVWHVWEGRHRDPSQGLSPAPVSSNRSSPPRISSSPKLRS